MKKAAFFAAWVFFALTAAAQEKTVIAGNGTLRKEKKEVPSYTGLSINGPFNVRLVHDEATTVTFEGDENILKLITAKVVDGTLHIGTKDDQPVRASRNNTIEIKVPYKEINFIRLKGTGLVYAAKTLRESDLSIELEGSGSIRLSTDSGNLKAVILGPGSIAVDGITENFDCAVSGSGTISACSLKTKYVKAVVSGCGDIQTNCTKKLVGKIAGNGTIAFSGNPSETDLRRSGNGKFAILNSED